MGATGKVSVAGLHTHPTNARIWPSHFVEFHKLNHFVNFEPILTSTRSNIYVTVVTPLYTLHGWWCVVRFWFRFTLKLRWQCEQTCIIVRAIAVKSSVHVNTDAIVFTGPRFSAALVDIFCTVDTSPPWRTPPQTIHKQVSITVVQNRRWAKLKLLNGS